MVTTVLKKQAPLNPPKHGGRLNDPPPNGFTLRSRLRTPIYSFRDLDCKREGWLLRQVEGYFLGWEKRRPNGTLSPMWYARFSRMLIPLWCLTADTIKSLPDLPVGEKVRV